VYLHGDCSIIFVLIQRCILSFTSSFISLFAAEAHLYMRMSAQPWDIIVSSNQAKQHIVRNDLLTQVRTSGCSYRLRRFLNDFVPPILWWEGFARRGYWMHPIPSV